MSIQYYEAYVVIPIIVRPTNCILLLRGVIENPKIGMDRDAVIIVNIPITSM